MPLDLGSSMLAQSHPLPSGINCSDHLHIILWPVYLKWWPAKRTFKCKRYFICTCSVGSVAKLRKLLSTKSKLHCWTIILHGVLRPFASLRKVLNNLWKVFAKILFTVHKGYVQTVSYHNEKTLNLPAYNSLLPWKWN